MALSGGESNVYISLCVSSSNVNPALCVSSTGGRGWKGIPGGIRAKVEGRKCICGWRGREDAMRRNGVGGNRKASLHLQSVLGVGSIW